ncbi:MAG TPA: hypothetical protein VIP70_12695 [Nitrososphaeraceae archaeon]
MNRRSSDQIKNVNFLDTNAQAITTLPSSRTVKKKKGKHASSTESRRIVWENIIWPLILETDRQYFTVQEYRTKKGKLIRTRNIYSSSSQLSGGLISLMNKGILAKDKGLYSIHYRLVPYLRKKVKLDYGLAARETYV